MTLHREQTWKFDKTYALKVSYSPWWQGRSAGTLRAGGCRFRFFPLQHCYPPFFEDHVQSLVVQSIKEATTVQENLNFTLSLSCFLLAIYLVQSARAGGTLPAPLFFDLRRGVGPFLPNLRCLRILALRGAIYLPELRQVRDIHLLIRRNFSWITDSLGVNGTYFRCFALFSELFPCICDQYPIGCGPVNFFEVEPRFLGRNAATIPRHS